MNVGRSFFPQDCQGVAQIAQEDCVCLKVFQTNWKKPFITCSDFKADRALEVVLGENLRFHSTPFI